MTECECHTLLQLACTIERGFRKELFGDEERAVEKVLASDGCKGTELSLHAMLTDALVRVKIWLIVGYHTLCFSGVTTATVSTS